MTTEHAIATPTRDYVELLQVTAGTEQVLAALTEPDEMLRWWTSFTRSERDGDEVSLFTRHAAPLVLRVERPSADQVAWTVLSCDFLPDWVGTKPTFVVRPGDGGTIAVAFHHIGLGPALACFDQCRAGWDHFLQSLTRYVDTGAGLPDRPRAA